MDETIRAPTASASASLASTHIQFATQLVQRADDLLQNHKTLEAMRAYHLSHLHTRGFAHPDAHRPKPSLKTTQAEWSALRALELNQHASLAQCHMRRKAYARARDCATSALALETAHLKSLLCRARCHARLGAMDLFKADLHRMLTIDPNNREAHIELARAEDHVRNFIRPGIRSWTQLDTDGMHPPQLLKMCEVMGVDSPGVQPIGLPTVFEPRDATTSQITRTSKSSKAVNSSG